MDALTAINTRISASKLDFPGPTPEQLDIILKAGGRAPDHGRLTPWRFVVIEGAAREAFGKLMAEVHLRHSPQATGQDLQREVEKARRAPTIVAVAAHIKPSPKVPDIEQIVAVGTAVQNMFLAAHALGLGAMWKTGAPAYDSALKSALGFDPSDHIVAFLYLGTVAALPPGPIREQALESFISRL